MTRRCLFITLLAALLLAPAFAWADEPQGTAVTIDGLTSKTPAAWKDANTTRQFRIKQFAVPRAEGDTAETEVVVFFFGAGSGGGRDANLTRWRGQFKPAPGKTANDIATTSEFKVGEVPVLLVDLAGVYQYRVRPGDPNVEERPNYRMLAVIFESPKGPYFITMVGPEKTVTQNHKDFVAWIKNFK